MSWKTIGVCVAAMLLGGCAAAANPAAAARSKLWLRDGAGRGVAGETVKTLMFVEECTLEQPYGSLLSNGRPVDKMASGPVYTSACAPGEKLAGELTAISAAESEPGMALFALTVHDKLHLQVEPWCTYRFPRRFTTPPTPMSNVEGSFQAPLDVGASFASCPPTREVFYTLRIFSEHGLYEGESGS